MNPELMEKIPNEHWVALLRPDDKVWLIKQNEFAIVEWPFYLKQFNIGSGNIGLKVRGASQSWVICTNGRGNDGSQCLWPVKNQISNLHEEYSEFSYEQLIRHIKDLEFRIGRMEQLRAIGDSFNLYDLADLQSIDYE